VITLSVDEMTGVQALQRCAETRRMQPGRLERREFEYIRQGTKCLLAGLNVATGQVFGDCREQRKEGDFLAFIQALEADNPGYKQLRIVADNLNTHQSASLVEYVASLSETAIELGVKGKSGVLKSQQSRADFLSRPEHKITFYYTPKHASWMNQIEVWFGVITRKVITRGNFCSADDLKDKLLAFIDYFNRTMAKPYQWQYTGKVLKY